MRLANCTCQRVNDYLKEHDSIMLVLGSTENHGRHMPLGTDTMIPDKIAELTEKQSHIMIAPTLPYGATDSLILYLIIVYFLNSRRPPTFPQGCPCSILGRISLNHRVRDGYGCFPQAHRHRKACYQSLDN